MLWYFWSGQLLNECLITTLNQRKLKKGETGRFDDMNFIEISIVVRQERSSILS